MASLRFVLLLASAACALGSILIDEVETEKSWQHFKQEHNKVYYSLDEELFRKSVFERSLQEVFEHKLAYDRGEESYYLSINQFSDMPFDEFIRTITCQNVTKVDVPESSKPDIVDLVRELGNPPASMNWDAAGYVNPRVKNQNIGSCGGCYAFAAVAAIESNYAIKNKLKNKVPDLSEQEVIDCGGSKFGLNGCSGGHPCGAYDFIKHVGGLATEKEYPWRKTQHSTPQKGACKLSKKMKLYGKPKAYWEHNDVTEMDFNLSVYVGLKGPTTATVCVNKKFKAYGGGVFKDKNCFKECNTPANGGVNHNTLAFGYNKDVFLIRNSWGTKWGINGNMEILRVKESKAFGICGLGVDQSYPIMA